MFPNGTCNNSTNAIVLTQEAGRCSGENGKCGAFIATNINVEGMGKCLISTLTVPKMHSPIMIKVGTLALNGTEYFDYTIELLAIRKYHVTL